MYHLANDRIGSAKKSSCESHIALCYLAPYPAAAYLGSFHGQLVIGCHRKTVAQGAFLKEFNIAGSLVPKAEILANNHQPCSELINQYIFYECLRLHACSLFSKRIGDQVIKTRILKKL